MDDEHSTQAPTITMQFSSELSGPGVSLLIYHRDGSHMVSLQEGQSIIIGRARPSDIPVRDRSLSRQHARFTFINGEMWVEDLGSTNGTLLNGKKITQRRMIREKDEVRLGGILIGVYFFLSDVASRQGLDSHDKIMEKLEQELIRAELFHRSTALIMVRASERKGGHISRWSPRISNLLRPIDVVALYDTSSVLILLPELDQLEARQLAENIIGKRQAGEPELRCGIAICPDHATSAEQLMETVRIAAQHATAKETVQLPSSNINIISESSEEQPVVINSKMQDLFLMAKRIADASSPVLIYGETGTGKEILARTIHQQSRRRKRPLRCINCAAIPESLLESILFGHERGSFTGADQRTKGVFEEADGGMVLLDEIGELSPSAQAALLRVIETKRASRIGSNKEFAVDVRILAATHRNLEEMCETNAFRWDLYFRLNTLIFKIPPLRERVEDILPLAEYFMRTAGATDQYRVRQIDKQAQKLLVKYQWPGNVRELRNTIERAVLIAQDDTITADDLSERIRRGFPLADSSVVEADAAPSVDEETGSIKEKLRRYETKLLMDALEANDWNQTQTAKSLGMPLRTLVHKMQSLGLKKKYEKGNK